MFTGLIQQVGHVQHNTGRHLWIAYALPPDAVPFGLGESIAVNGVCLTVAEVLPGRFRADLSAATRSYTTLESLEAGTPVNLEQALRVGDRLGGHIVQGHVDTVLTLRERREEEQGLQLTWELPEQHRLSCIVKGSIAMDGVSLTIAILEATSLTAFIVPHTLHLTQLATLRPGMHSNVEFDLLAKYVSQQLAPYLGEKGRNGGDSHGFCND